jgi:hypothetical protein
MLFPRSSASPRASPLPGKWQKPFFEECWYPDKLHQSRDIGRDNALVELVDELKRKTEKSEREFGIQEMAIG